jgi:hypothetical protein
LLRQATVYEQEGLKDLAAALRRQADGLSVQQPLATAALPLTHGTTPAAPTTQQVHSNSNDPTSTSPPALPSPNGHGQPATEQTEGEAKAEPAENGQGENANGPSDPPAPSGRKRRGSHAN